jgi:hypothetical protein
MEPRLMDDGAQEREEGSTTMLGRLMRKARGQSVVEFAISLPVLALICLGTLDMGQMFFSYIELRGAVREAAAYGARAPSDTTGMEHAVYVHSPDLADGTTVEVDVSQDPAAIQIYDNATVTVTATRVFTPLTLSFFQQFGMGSVTLKCSATARVWT